MHKIKASDLRTGNVIWGITDSPADPGKKELFRVAGINAQHNTLVEADDHITQVDYCEGILLTPELLQGCGFVNEGDENVTWYVLQTDVVGFVGELKNGIIEVYLDALPEVRIRYFHQLQNVCYFLTGKELDI